MSKRLLVVNVVLAAVAVAFAVSLVRDLSRARPLPPPPAPPQAPVGLPAAEQATEPVIAPESLAGYNVIVARHLFNPSRSESGAAAAAPAAPPPPKPLLLGVVVDGAQSRAYLEDPSTKRVFSYRIGDTVAGGRLEKVTDDKVVIVRPDGPMEVMLRDPSNPKPAPATPGPPMSPPAPAMSPPAPAMRPPASATPPAAVARPPASPGSTVESAVPTLGARGGRGAGGRR